MYFKIAKCLHGHLKVRRTFASVHLPPWPALPPRPMPCSGCPFAIHPHTHTHSRTHTHVCVAHTSCVLAQAHLYVASCCFTSFLHSSPLSSSFSTFSFPCCVLVAVVWLTVSQSPVPLVSPVLFPLKLYALGKYAYVTGSFTMPARPMGRSSSKGKGSGAGRGSGKGKDRGRQSSRHGEEREGGGSRKATFGFLPGCLF